MRRGIRIGLMLIAILLCVSPFAAAEKSAHPSPKLIKQWQTENLLDIPESVLCDPSGEFVYVSNISGKGKEKNGKGFISKVSLTGKILERKWATGLNAPKGMAIYQNRLYVADIDRLVEISLSSGEIAARHSVPGARFLNDVAADAAGNIYVSDTSSKNSVIYRLSEGKVDVWLTGSGIKKPNGLCMENGRLLVGNSGDKSIKRVDLSTKKVETISDVGTGIDGLSPDGKGNYLVSDWKGRTSFVPADGKVVLLMDTRALKISAADFAFIADRNLLLIPTFYGNRVVAYKVQWD